MRTFLNSATSTSTTDTTSDSTAGQIQATVSADSTNGATKAVATAKSEVITAHVAWLHSQPCIQSFAKMESKLVKFFKYVNDNVKRVAPESEPMDKFCTDAFAVIESKLEAVGSATASAYAETLATVEITGDQIGV